MRSQSAQAAVAGCGGAAGAGARAARGAAACPGGHSPGLRSVPAGGGVNCS